MKSLKLMLAALASLALLTGLGARMPHDGIEEIMEKGFKKGGLRHQLSTEIDKDQPNWAAVEKNAKAFSTMCVNLCKEKAPQGDAESWKKLTEQLAKQAQTLSSAAGKKDLANAKTAITKINGSCKECHDAHRP
ncbi:MAG: cytochrome c [Gemmatales bacterium]